MILTPESWQKIGQPISILDIENAIIKNLKQIDCKNLALSGGVDSSLLLSLMIKAFGYDNIKCFNIAYSMIHPDYIYSEMIAKHFGVDLIHWIPCEELKRTDNDLSGDEIVREFYRWIYNKNVGEIIAGDGVDEYNCGYYAHMKDPSEETYYHFLRILLEEQLKPLDKNSGKLIVHLPYIYDEIIILWSQISLKDKIDSENRKKIICKLAESNNIPNEIIYRHKYGFCDAMHIKESKNVC